MQAGQVWFPDSAYKTAQAIQDLNKGEGLPLVVLANWRIATHTIVVEDLKAEAARAELCLGERRAEEHPDKPARRAAAAG